MAPSRIPWSACPGRRSKNLHASWKAPAFRFARLKADRHYRHAARFTAGRFSFRLIALAWDFSNRPARGPVHPRKASSDLGEETDYSLGQGCQPAHLCP
jgi:hypothetical protein